MTSRRSFLAASAGVLAVLPRAPWTPRRPVHDLVVRGGLVLDGSGAAGITADVAVSGGRMTAVGEGLAGLGSVEIDARGLVVTPGFVDIHSHADGTLDEDPRLESVVRQGITTVVVGQDGSSGAPRAGADSAGTFGAMLAALDRRGPGVNIASMIGLGSVRGAVVGLDDRPATPTELARMVAMVEEALAAGACGASSGLEYTPGAFARAEELVALCQPLAARRLPYSTHLRNEDDRLLDAIDEAIAVARAARCPLQVAHLKTQGPRNWRRLDDAFARIEQARRDGVDAMFDRYPYTAYQTGLTSLFPVWSRDGGMAAFLARLDGDPAADRIRAETLAKVELIGGWNNVQITSVRATADRAAEGRRLGEYAADRGADPYETTVGLLRRSGGAVGMVGFAMSEENLDRILAHPLGMVCSDGGAFATDGPTRRGSPHPRGAGSFPRVLARYVRQRRALTLEAAVHKMSALPASRVGLTDRGRIGVGMAADLVVFDPDTVADTATYEQPFSYPTGIAAVVVNGAVALREGQRAAGRSGRVVGPG